MLVDIKFILFVLAHTDIGGPEKQPYLNLHVTGEYVQWAPLAEDADDFLERRWVGNEFVLNVVNGHRVHVQRLTRSETIYRDSML